MKKLLRWFLRSSLSIMCLLNLSVLSGQVPGDQLLVQRFQHYSQKNIQEKIYAHLNRQDHLTGEILWFKIYCVDALLHQPLNLSKIAYVEILDADSKPVLQTKVPLENGSGNGSFFIPATLSTGSYLFRVYTNWMKNVGPDFFFQQGITIINTLRANETQRVNFDLPSLEIQFYPEGGQLVENLKSKLGFQVLDKNGKGVDCSGVIINKTNDTLVRFRSLKFGIGSFSFTPRPNQIYRALIKTKYQTVQGNLPSVRRYGYVLYLTDTLNDKIKVKVSSNETTLAVQLFVHTRQSIKFSRTQSSDRGFVEFLVNKSTLGDGISHFTVFGNNIPVCERLYFKKPSQILSMDLHTDQNAYSVRRKVQLQIKTDPASTGDVSVSVFRADSIPQSNNIISNLFLSSDLRGRIESPFYYFSDDQNVAAAADNLMLTHGWRRFKWDAIMNNQVPTIQYLPELMGHLVIGKIVDETGKPMSGKVGYLASPGKKIKLYVAKSDTSGKILFRIKDFQESGKVIVQTNSEQDSLCHIELENPFHPNPVPWHASKIILSPGIEETLISRSIAMQVQDVFYEDQTYFRFVKSAIDSLPFYGKADELYKLDDYIRFPVMEEVLREYVKGVWVRKRKDNFRFMVMNKASTDTEVFQDNPLTLLDGVPMFDINRVLEIDPLKVKKIEVMTRRYYLGPLELHGIISLSTYNGDLGGIQLDPRSVTLDYEGLQSQREFYNPRYTSAELRGSRLPDQRHQLYWNPNIKLNKGTTAPVEFYTSDVEGNFYVIIEGLSSTGSAGFTYTSFKVSQ